jgi:hypothetical protein
MIDEKKPYVMTWQQIRELTKKGANIANHSAEHLYLHQKLESETLIQWQNRIKQDLVQSEERIAQETGHNYKYLAYPYGEFNHELQNIIKELDFIGIGQHSGAVGIHSDFSRLPRFPASGIYANLKTLKTKLKSLPFNIVKLTNSESVTATSQPSLIMQLVVKDFYKSQFACYVSGQGKSDLKWLGKKTVEADESDYVKSVEISPEKPLSKGRSRYNCTAPSISKKGHFYWFSQPWVVE